MRNMLNFAEDFFHNRISADMTWNDVIGQDRVKDILARAIAEGKVAHAYCLWGAEGIGKDALAAVFAEEANANVKGARCEWIYALPTPKNPAAEGSDMQKMSDEQLKEIRDELAKKIQNPYHRITIAGANRIKIGAIRELKRTLGLSSSAKGRRFVIITHADEMTIEAQNALLKTLEEPVAGVTIIMTTAKPDALLPTIMSRSQQIHCEPIDDEILISVLNKRHCIARDEGRLIAAFAQGSYSAALEFLDSDMKAFRESVVEILRTSLKRIYRNDLYTKLNLSAKSKDRAQVEKFLLLLMLWLRDAMLLAKCGTSASVQIINIDQTDSLESFARNFGSKDFPQALATIEEAISRLKRNVAPDVLLLAMFAKLREIFVGR